MSENLAMDRIYELYDRHESWTAVARELEISPSYLSDITGGRREISAKLAKRLGCSQKLVYVEATSDGRP